MVMAVLPLQLISSGFPAHDRRKSHQHYIQKHAGETPQYSVLYLQFLVGTTGDASASLALFSP